MGYILEFSDAPSTAMFSLAPETAIAFFKAKGLKPTFDYRDMIQQEHDVAFTVAKMMDVDLLRTTQGLVDKGIREGWSKERFAKELGPKLQAAGWWGKGDLEDPLTGTDKRAQLGSAHRLNTIYRSNLQSAYSVGQWERIIDQADEAPYLIYDAVDDQRTREEHAAWDNTALPIDDPWWDTHMPPNGYNCRCGVIQASADELDAMDIRITKRPPIQWRQWTNPRTGKTHKVPAGVDPGWAHNPGKRRLAHLQELLGEKVATLPPRAQQAFNQGMKASETKAAVQGTQQALAKAEAARHLEQSQAKIQQRTAQWKIDDALANGTPYLAKAIKQVQGTKGAGNLSPVQLLAKANEKAAAAEKSASLTTYKQYIAKGKTPPAKASAVYDTLSAEEKATVNDQIAALQAKKAAEEALAELEDGSGVYAQALAKLKASGEADGMSPVALWKAVTDAGDAAKAKIAQGVNLANYKKAVIAGKTPKDAQLQAYKALDDEAKAAIDDEVAQAKAAKAAAATTPGQDTPAPPSPQEAAQGADTATIHPGALVRIGPQAGSNPGGLFVDEETGAKWYVKQPASADIARNEVLAGKLYQAAGVEVPEMEMIDFQGQPSIASRIIDDLEHGKPAQLASAAGTREAFLVDAWLANWDVVGLGYDNLLIKGGRAVRVDTGGALRYRAQGGSKGAAWGDTVSEIDSLRDPGTNPQAAAVFGQVSRDDLVAGARKVLAIDEDQIRRLVDAYGPPSAAERDALVATLRARQADIRRRFPEADDTPEPVPQPAGSGERVTPGEARTIAESRANGYAIATDRDMVEDQEVLLWHEYDQAGKALTGADLKLRGRGLDAIETQLGAGGEFDIKGDLDDRIRTAVKGMKAFGESEGLRDKDVARAKAAIAAWHGVVQRLKQLEADGVIKQSQVIPFKIRYQKWIDALEQVVGLPIGTKNPLKSPNKTFAAARAPEMKRNASALGLVAKEDNPFTIKRIENGRAEHTSAMQTRMPTSRFYEGTIEGARVRYWPRDSQQHAMAGRLLIESPGGDAAAASRVYAALERMGIDTQRPGAHDSEELYLRQTAYALVQGYRQLETQLADITDQGERIRALRAHIKTITGQDVAGLPTYRPEGRHEAFGHGHRRRYRPDLHGQAWETFKRDYRLIHENTGGQSTAEVLDLILGSGGKMAPTIDKLRRGIPLGGMSPEADLRTGGASYFFTRIRKRTQAAKTAGFVWKADQLGRLDAIAYNHDAFGRTSGDYVLEHRKGTIDQWQDNASRVSNEVIFKGGLSLFDQLDSIVAASAAEREAIIQVLKKHGYARWPDGRELTEVVVTR